ncbi:hypothetical protein DPMN_075643 [Dreissena polymorpha]|uniref:Uncharacterized protein n=1 Tax=Dreissena polymorpha TaxID=45954 RepID=A0A9D4BMV4_DREPO|nr:hypothetical protein DPMN_075643 [Dreissena polymorpha]
MAKIILNRSSIFFLKVKGLSFSITKEGGCGGVGVGGRARGMVWVGNKSSDHVHEDWTINVTSRALTVKTARPPGGHFFQWTGTIFKLSRAIIRINVLTKFHEDWTLNVSSRVFTRKTASPHGGRVFQPTETIFKLK